jgi:hypothetical protein
MVAQMASWHVVMREESCRWMALGKGAPAVTSRVRPERGAPTIRRGAQSPWPHPAPYDASFGGAAIERPRRQAPPPIRRHAFLNRGVDVRERLAIGVADNVAAGHLVSAPAGGKAAPARAIRILERLGFPCKTAIARVPSNHTQFCFP